jgi:hypothetical protein
MKNIDNRSKDSSGLVVKNTDSVPEGTVNLYYTISRVNTLIESNSNYKNAESLFSAPISGPGVLPGGLLSFDGAIWQVTNNLRLHDGDDVRTAGDYSFPAATNATIGPRSLAKLSGNQIFANINIPVDGMRGFIELFITARDDVSGAMYQNNCSFFYENNAGTVTFDIVNGFYSSAFTMAVVGTTIELHLTTVNAATVTFTMKYQSVTGAGLTIVTF